MLSLSSLYQLRKALSNCAIPPSKTDFGTLAARLNTLMESIDCQSFVFDDDTAQRRSLLAILWRFVQLDWIQNQFKCIGHPLCARIAGVIFVDMRNATFTNERVWFAGVSRIQTFTSTDLGAANECSSAKQEDRAQMRQNSALYFALGLFLIGFHKKIEEIVPANNPIECLGHFVAKLDQMYVGSPNIFMDALLENDERCLQTMAALQRIDNESNNMQALFRTVPTIASANILALSMLRKIDFDPLVIIDWVSSEPEVSFVFLKQFSHRLAQLSHHELAQLCASFIKMPSSESAVNECRFQIVVHQQQNLHSTTTAVEYDEDNGNKFFQFNIEELHGQQNVLRNVIVPKKTNCTIQQVPKQQRHGMDLMPYAECSADQMCQKMKSFCAELRQKLRTLAKHLHFPEKSICDNLQQFLDNNLDSSDK